MTGSLSRRQLVAGMAAVGLAAGMAPAARAATPPRKLVATTGTLEVNGRAARVLRLADEDGRLGLTLTPGEAFHVELENRLAEKTIIHWHGQLPPWQQDGFPWPETPPLAPGARASYNYAPIPGTFWMHSHQGMQEQRLLTAPLIVRSTEEMQEDRQEVVLMLHDFSFRPPEEILAGLIGSQAADAPAGNAMSMNMNMNMAKPAVQSSGSPSMDLNDVDYDAFLANERTLADPAVIPVERGGRIRLRVINGASSSAFWLDLGRLSGKVVAVDGHGVAPIEGSRFPLSIAQRLDILVDLPASGGAFPVFALLEGSVRRTGVVLRSPDASVARLDPHAPAMTPAVDNSLERQLRALHPLPDRQADQRARFLLDGGMHPYHWTLNGETWPQVQPLMVRPQSRVEIDLVNRSMMAHPMHLHGHAFQVVAIGGKRVAGAIRDTVLVEPDSSLRIAFDAGNPGRWAFHCHNLYHMMTGMMTEVRYDGISV
ncbi:MAG TPA: multicopper oxidase family protein [Acidisoma sp.]|uniref:multicopper oxidase family protein n=1 Tax=Acidisoma sp. TaxID=1872115 RepID=UPI002C8D1D75|nr:multicopper oxidase family protein [Acidisoma sp.]HTI03010.1 multicopper oxidase family protein [Acidisoma sp.]